MMIFMIALFLLLISDAKAAAQDVRSMCRNNRPKLFANNLTIQCPFPENDCRWYQLRDNVQQPVETDELIANNSIFLLENNAYSYGEYTARSSNNESVCYTVCPFPIESVCDNCSNIMINGVINPPEVNVCNGTTISITLLAPQNLFGIVINTLRINGSSDAGSKACSPIKTQSVRSRNLTYECRNVQSLHSGTYSGHVGFSCNDTNPEWCSLNVSVTIRNCNESNVSSTPPTTMIITSSQTPLVTTSTTTLTSSIISSFSTSTSLFPTVTMTMDDTDDDTETSPGLIIGIPIGICVLVAIFIFIAVLCWFWLFKKKKSYSPQKLDVATVNNGSRRTQNVNKM